MWFVRGGADRPTLRSNFNSGYGVTIVISEFTGTTWQIGLNDKLTAQKWFNRLSCLESLVWVKG